VRERSPVGGLLPFVVELVPDVVISGCRSRELFPPVRAYEALANASTTAFESDGDGKGDPREYRIEVH